MAVKINLCSWSFNKCFYKELSTTLNIKFININIEESGVHSKHKIMNERTFRDGYNVKIGTKHYESLIDSSKNYEWAETKYTSVLEFA